ncbi:MAG TPA: ferredoxin family protein [Firmicutes bacterium]|nr:ferredoxin family protein [Bacillota bacterium]
MPRKTAREIRINAHWCKKCGICIAFCPTKVLEAGEDGTPVVARLEACTVCQLCELRCPDFAVEVFPDGGEGVRDVQAAVNAG